MGTEGGLRARKLSGVTVRTWALREGPLLAVECSRIRDGAGARAGWRSLHGESSWPWDPPSPSPQAFVRSFSVAVGAEYHSEGVTVQVPDSAGTELKRDSSGSSEGEGSEGGGA